MFSFFRRQKTSDSDKNGKGDKDKKDSKTKEKYTAGLSSPGPSVKKKDEHGPSKPSNLLVGTMLQGDVLKQSDKEVVFGKDNLSVEDRTSTSTPIAQSTLPESCSSTHDSGPINNTELLGSTLPTGSRRTTESPNSWTSTSEADDIAKSGDARVTLQAGSRSTSESLNSWGSTTDGVEIVKNDDLISAGQSETLILSTSSMSDALQIDECVIGDDLRTAPQTGSSVVSTPPMRKSSASGGHGNVKNDDGDLIPPVENESDVHLTSSTTAISRQNGGEGTEIELATSNKSIVFPVGLPEEGKKGRSEGDQEEVQLRRTTPLESPKSTLIKHSVLSATPVIEQDDKKVQIKSGWKKLEDVKREKEMLEMQKRNLVSQEARFQEQLAELKAQLTAKDTETNKLCYKMEELQRDVSVKSSGMDRLQAELTAAHLESQCVRQKLRLLENDVAEYRQKNVDLSDELTKKAEEVATAVDCSSEKVVELETNVKVMEAKIKQLEKELEEIRVERDMLEEERAEMEAEREEEMKIVQEALEEVEDEKTEIQTRYEKDFEKLRSVNTDREQQLLNDFEWKLREVEQACKRRLEDKDKKLEEKLTTVQAEMAGKIKDAEKQLNEFEKLKVFEAEAIQLRTMSHDQQKSLRLAARQTEQLQVSELILKEEVTRLRSTVEKEKNSAALLQTANEKRIVELENKLHNRLQLQKTELNDQWEQRLRRECSRLKTELDHLHEEEKHLVVESLKIQKDQEAQVNKQSWEKRLQDSLKEISTLKEQITAKEMQHQNEMERAQTNTDRDILELRRKLDKMDMTYQSQIEKLKESHEVDIEQLTWESGRKIQQLEQSWQQQTSSSRTTLELVKEQMERDSQSRLEEIKEKHRIELEQQWVRLAQEKEVEIQQLEENHLLQLQSVKEEFQTAMKNCNARETDLVATKVHLEEQLNNKSSVIGDLQSNAELLHGSVQVLSDQVVNHGKDLLRVENQASQKIREREAEMEAAMQQRLAEVQEQHTLQAAQWQTQFNKMNEQINSLSISLQESRAINEKRPSREEDVKRIGDLQRMVTERDRRLAIVNEELRLCEVELLNRDTICISKPITGILDPLQYMHGPKKKSGGISTVDSSSQQNLSNPPSSPVASKASTSHSAGGRSVEFPIIKVPFKSPTRKSKKNSKATQNANMSTL